ncbi:OVARIAN TUMOR DOMAIN-containing deubiquitinating enzyme 4-like [Actinidia eriantha]|uniref:OVARIAN TUMOR DOMAIN-containing deubiquitinating enzyme 4-like n=1 Tax=Actinidia eriantha TaxID=165200 RepID=UPI0025858A7B|nr:OVARIAN TUMOR DOMAIN-containing deubiquitinating enzyme 4-like [Actinidia eriantha]
MLGVLCARHKPWILASLSLAHTSPAALINRIAGRQIRLVVGGQPLRHHSSACRIAGGGGVAASIWHAILPSGAVGRRPSFHNMRGEGSWNVAWDARPARWLHRPDSAWLLFGVCACLSAPLDLADVIPKAVAVSDGENCNGCGTDNKVAETNHEGVAKHRVTGVTADGRCLFRAIAHVACVRNGEEAPDENRQRELADELRAQVVDELLRRRKETEWFMEEDFDTYVNRIRQPYVWGGEPELLMASHVLKTPITVFMIDRSSGDLIKIANYGEEYQKDKESPITILFHGYGHYDILEAVSDQSCHNVEA